VSLELNIKFDVLNVKFTLIGFTIYSAARAAGVRQTAQEGCSARRNFSHLSLGP
jgi:hypothetical protein